MKYSTDDIIKMALEIQYLPASEYWGDYDENGYTCQFCGAFDRFDSDKIKHTSTCITKIAQDILT